MDTIPVASHILNGDLRNAYIGITLISLQKTYKYYLNNEVSADSL